MTGPMIGPEPWLKLIGPNLHDFLPMAGLTTVDNGWDDMPSVRAA